jgi:pimeloyl-ACP methyl ester carboxylesterase
MKLHRLRLRSEPIPESDENDSLETESAIHRTEHSSTDSGKNTSIASTRFRASIPYRSGSLISTTSTLNAGTLGRPITHSNRSRDDLGLHLVIDRLQPSGDIVFVHGLGGHPWTTWSWERDLNNFWPIWLEDEGALSTWRVFTFGYDSNWRGAGANLNISDFAKDLLLQILTFTSSNGCSVRPKKIIFVAHSMGGLVVKKAFLLGKQDLQFTDIAASFYGIIFLATPHRGAQSASTLNNILASLPLGPPSKSYVAELQLHSNALHEINEQFRHHCHDLALMSYFETEKTSIGLKDTLVAAPFFCYCDSVLMAIGCGERFSCSSATWRDVRLTKSQSSHHMQV